MSGPAGTAPGASGTAATNRYLTFTLNGQAYALDILHVTEILEYPHVTPLPMMPAYIRGVIDLRGRAVPVIDLAVRFACGEATIDRRTSIVIVHIGDVVDPAGGHHMGILVDAVNKVVDFTEEDIEPAPALGPQLRAEFISGMAKRDNEFTILLNISNVLSLSEAEFIAGGPAEVVTG
jgi:purine-binding chemotaxis protein CheW